LQVPGSTHYSMVFYFVSKQLVPGSLLQRFVDGDDEFRNSRFKLIPSVPKVFILSWCWLILSALMIGLEGLDDPFTWKTLVFCLVICWHLPHYVGFLDCAPERWKHPLFIRESSRHYLYSGANIFGSKKLLMHWNCF